MLNVHLRLLHWSQINVKISKIQNTLHSMAKSTLVHHLLYTFHVYNPTPRLKAKRHSQQQLIVITDDNTV